MAKNFGEKEASYSMKAVHKLRKKGVICELYPDSAKLKKQFNYANKRQIPFVVMVGTSEMENNEYTLKNMTTGEQKTIPLQELLDLM